MPNVIDANGLQVASYAELLATYNTAFQTIFGADINLDQNSPDGQMIGIFIQTVLDTEDLLMQIYNGFDPDNAVGVVLDQRVAINGIQRQGGTFTVTNISIVAAQALTLFGLDQTLQPVYTIQDNAGTQWQLQVTQNISGPGTTVAAFQAANPGAQLTTPNTITVPVTIVLGVTSINNPTTYTILGINQESDAALKIRRQKSVSLASQGYLAGLLAALENVTGVTSAFVYENNTNATDINGIPSHSIWVIVAGSYANADVAQAIYSKRNAGCGMFGNVDYTITQVDGSPFVVRWDVVTSQALYIKFTATSLNGINPPNIALIKSQLPTLYQPSVNQEVNINGLATIVQSIDPNCLVTSAGFSTSPTGPFTSTLSPTAKTQFFVVTANDTIIIPMILSPSLATVLANGSQQMTGLGGFGTLNYSMQSNPSGGSVNSSTGLYTAGATTGVTDVVLVTDSQSNTATASITVVS